MKQAQVVDAYIVHRNAKWTPSRNCSAHDIILAGNGTQCVNCGADTSSAKIRPLFNYGKSFCLNCTKVTMHQLNSDGYSNKPDFQCQECGRHIDMLYGA